jgi:hypothetical protein
MDCGGNVHFAKQGRQQMFVTDATEVQ